MSEQPLRPEIRSWYGQPSRTFLPTSTAPTATPWQNRDNKYVPIAHSTVTPPLVREIFAVGLGPATIHRGLASGEPLSCLSRFYREGLRGIGPDAARIGE